MQTLVGRNSYAEIEDGFWKRARKVIGTIFGVVMCLASIIQQASVLGFGLALSFGLVIGAVTGICFGWLWAWAMRRSARKYFDRVYAGDSGVIGEIPANRKPVYRIPCSKFVTNNVTAGGVLYVGKDGVQFIPHRRYRDEDPIELEPENLVVWAKDWKPNWWGRTFVASGPRILELGVGDLRFRFALPDVDVVIPRIRDALGHH